MQPSTSKTLKSSKKMAKNFTTHNNLRYRPSFDNSVIFNQKLKVLYDDWHGVHLGELQDFRVATKNIELSEAFTLHNMIDWYALAEETYERKHAPVGSKSLHYIDYATAPRSTKTWKAIKDFKNYDQTKYQPSNWWGLYSKFHMECEPHHMDYWHLHAGIATFNDTIELLADEVVSAMRLRSDLLEAFLVSMTWKFDIVSGPNGKIVTVKDKYKRLDPSAVLYFILHCAGRGFSTDASNYIFTYSQSIRNRVYPFDQVLAINQMIEKPFDPPHWSKVYQNHMNAHFGNARSAFKDMLRESQQHIVGVQNLFREITGKSRCHDHSKTNFFMNACLSLKFLKYSEPKDLSKVPKNLAPVNGVKQVNLTNEPTEKSDLNNIWPTPALECTGVPFIVATEMPDDSYVTLCHELDEFFDIFYNNVNDPLLEIVFKRLCKNPMTRFIHFKSILENIQKPLLKTWYCMLKNGQIPLIILPNVLANKKDLYALYFKNHFWFRNVDSIDDLFMIVDPLDFDYDEDSDDPMEGISERVRVPPHDLGCMQYDMLAIHMDYALVKFKTDVGRYFDTISLVTKTALEAQISECIADGWFPAIMFSNEAFSQQKFYMDLDEFVNAYKAADALGPALGQTISSFNSLATKLTGLCTGIDVNANTKVFSDLKDLLTQTLTEYRVLASQTTSAITRSSAGLSTTLADAGEKIKSLGVEDLAAQFSTMMNGMADMSEIVGAFFKKLNFFIPNFVKPFGFSCDSIKNLEFGDVTACIILYIFYINTVGDLKYVYLLALLFKLGILHQMMKGATWVLENLGFIDPPSENFGNDDDSSECMFSVEPIVQVLKYVFCDHKYLTAMVAVTVIVGFVGYSHLHTANIRSVHDFHSNVVKTSRDVGYIGHGITGATKIFGFISTGMVVASKWILNNVFKKEFKTADELVIQNLTSWMTNVEFFDSHRGRNLIVSDTRWRDVANMLYAKGEVFRNAALEDRIPRGTLQSILAYQKKAKSVKEFCDSVNNTKSGRMCTRHINFEGASNIGKSLLMPAVSDAINHHFYPEKIPSSFAITQQMIASDDWDNYRSDIPVVTIDDLGAIREPREAATVITLCSNANLTVPVAALEHKGVQFESEFLITSCNKAFPADLGDTLRTPDAYFNRFHYSFKVIANSAFSKAFDVSGRFSPSSFKKYFPGHDLELREWLLFTHQRRDNNTGAVVNATGPNGESFVEGTWTEMLKYLLANLEIDRALDPFRTDKTKQLHKDVREWFNTVKELKLNLEEDHGIGFPMLDRISMFNQQYDYAVHYDRQLIENYQMASSLLTSSDIEGFCDSLPSETSYTTFDKFWENSRTAKFKSFLPADKFVFKLDEHFIEEISAIHPEPIDSRLVFSTSDTPDDPIYPNICMPKQFVKHFTCASSLRKMCVQLETAIPKAHENKFVTYLEIDRADLEVLFKPSFIAALQRYIDAPTSERVLYFKNVILKNGKAAPLIADLRKWLSTCRAKVSGFCRQLTDIAIAFKNWMIENWKINLTLLLAFGGCVWAIQRLARVFLGEATETAAYTNLSANKANRQLQSGISHRSSIAGHLLSIPDHIVQQNEKIQKNQFILVGDVGSYCHGLGIKGDLAVLNYHSIAGLFTDPTSSTSLAFSLFRFPNFSHSTRVQISRADCIRIGQKDLVFVRINAVNFRDITPQLPTSKEYPTDLTDTTVTSYMMNRNNRCGVTHSGVVSSYSETYSYRTVENNTYKEDHHVVISFPVRKGQSGSFIVHNLPNSSSRILGIVSSSSRDSSHISSILKEDALKCFEDLGCSKLDGPLQMQEMSDIGKNFANYFEEHVPFVGEVTPSLQVTPYGKTEHFKSPISEYLPLPIETQPAILDIKDPRADGKFPLAMSVGKRSRDIKELYPIEISREATQAISNDICMRSRGWTREVCDPFTAVTGRRIDGYAAMDLNTSPGLPYLKHRSKPGKRDYLELDQFGQVVHFDSNLLADIEYTINAMKAGVIPNNSLYDFPKSEDLPNKKIFEVKTRSITNSNLCMNIIYRMFHMDLEACLHVMARNGTYWYAPGLNPESPAWENVYFRLASNNDHGWCFDISNYDGGFDSQMYDSNVKIDNDFYDDGPENARVRRCLAKNALNGFVQIGMLIYQSTRGMPSGFGGTTSYNTKGHMKRLYCAYLTLCARFGQFTFRNWNSFRKYVAVFIYGDDITFTVHPKIISWFNGNELAKEYQRCGWKVTMGVDKETVNIDDPEMIKGIPVKKLVFLKRGFTTVPEIPFIPCPLDLTSINAMLHWVRHGKHNSPMIQFYDNIYTALFSLYHHGRKIFEDYLRMINTGLSLARLDEINVSFLEIHHIMIHRYYGESLTNID